MISVIRDDYGKDRWPNKKGVGLIFLVMIPLVLYRLFLIDTEFYNGWIALGLFSFMMGNLFYVWVYGHKRGLGKLRYMRYLVTEIDELEYNKGKEEQKLAKQSTTSVNHEGKQD